MKDQHDNKTVDWVEVMALRSAYRHGIRTPETREACRIYMSERRKKKAKQVAV
ncbi:hypothetical protein [Acinetobacter schindleri]|uniref:hypothetical protein n=1 Tax=Acinetobacter schindleri TaxID=108981 RepID=UPI0028D85537|nr:hypothetical protein [Acinetobacter schindleri]